MSKHNLRQKLSEVCPFTLIVYYYCIELNEAGNNEKICLIWVPGLPGIKGNEETSQKDCLIAIH